MVMGSSMDTRVDGVEPQVEHNSISSTLTELFYSLLGRFLLQKMNHGLYNQRYSQNEYGRILRVQVKLSHDQNVFMELNEKNCTCLINKNVGDLFMD